MKSTIVSMRFVIPLLVLCGVTGAFAGSVTLTSLDQGWYDNTGFNDPTDTDYVIGNASFGGPWNDFFTFDSSTLSGQTVTGAVLDIFNPAGGFSSYRPSEAVSIGSFMGSLTDLTTGNGGVAAYNALGSGTVFGTVSVSGADNDSLVQITLNNAFLAYINSDPGAFALGGTLSTLDPIYTADQYAFAFSSEVPTVPQLVLTTGTSVVTGAVPDSSPRGLIEFVVLIVIVGCEVYRRKQGKVNAC